MTRNNDLSQRVGSVICQEMMNHQQQLRHYELFFSRQGVNSFILPALSSAVYGVVNYLPHMHT